MLWWWAVGGAAWILIAALVIGRFIHRLRYHRRVRHANHLFLQRAVSEALHAEHERRVGQGADDESEPENETGELEPGH